MSSLPPRNRQTLAGQYPGVHRVIGSWASVLWYYFRIPLVIESSCQFISNNPDVFFVYNRIKSPGYVHPLSSNGIDNSRDCSDSVCEIVHSILSNVVHDYDILSGHQVILISDCSLKSFGILAAHLECYKLFCFFCHIFYDRNKLLCCMDVDLNGIGLPNGVSPIMVDVV